MKPINAFILLNLFFCLTVQGTPDINMEVYRFKADSVQYIEVSVYVVGSSLMCPVPAQAPYGIEYVILVKGEHDEVVAGSKYSLSRVGCPAKDIFDIKRFSLSAGKYSIELEARDLNDSLSRVSVIQDIEISSYDAGVAMSDLQLLAALENQPDGNSPMHKSGLYLEPLPFSYYYPAINRLSLYFETYHTELADGQPYVQYTIKPLKGDIPSPIVTYMKVRKEPVAVNVWQLDISTLISGYYQLQASLYDGNKKLLTAKEVVFSRFNPAGDSIFMENSAINIETGFASLIPEDSLDYDIRAMAPIVSSLDNEVINALIKKGSPKAKRYFIHKYWTTQAGNLAGPSFYSYMKVAKVVDENYTSGFGYGFESDRGHIFLKYGKPNEVIEVEDEPSAPPYEIWFYNSFPATHQTNVRFLFYNPSLTRNGHVLLHSTARGEVSNALWETQLYKDATLETPGVGEKVMGDNVHRNARTYFEN